MRTICQIPIVSWMFAATLVSAYQYQYDVAPATESDNKKSAEKSDEKATDRDDAEDNDDLTRLLQGVVQRGADRETRYVIPQGDVAILVKYLEKMSKFRPEDPVDVVEHQSKFRPTLQKVAERILQLEKDHKSDAYETARFIVLANRVHWLAQAVPSEQRRIIADVKGYFDEQFKRKNTTMASGLADAAVKAVQQIGAWDWAIELCDSFAAYGRKTDDAEFTSWVDTMRDTAEQLRSVVKEAPKSIWTEIAPMGKMTPLDLSKKLNWMTTDWTGGSFHGNGLSELPKGDQILGGVKFTITDQKMQLGCAQKADAPQKITGIPVNQKLHRLFVLQGSEWGVPGTVPEGTLLASNKLHYTDGSEASMPVAYGQDVRDWFDNDQGRPVGRGRVVWTGINSVAKSRNSTLRLYLGAWENPHPEKKVATIDYVKSDDTVCAPFCLAITAEE